MDERNQTSPRCVSADGAEVGALAAWDGRPMRIYVGVNRDEFYRFLGRRSAGVAGERGVIDAAFPKGMHMILPARREPSETALGGDQVASGQGRAEHTIVTDSGRRLSVGQHATVSRLFRFTRAPWPASFIRRV